MVYAPGTLETDPKKQNMALQEHARAIDANTADIATNTADIAALEAAAAAWPGTTVGQLPFPATQVPSSNANTLDDYEEGSATVQLQFGGGNTGLTTSISTCHYTKIGRQVIIAGAVRLTAVGSSTGSATITGLPFTSQSAVADLSFPVMLTANNMNAALSSPLSAAVNSNSSTLSLQKFASGAVSSMADTDFTATSVVRFAGSYFVT